ncbi:MAG TPA: hypothetical protein VGO69_06710 [Pyrinomonadaceae bacterium]|nr:hypothetical protein [Pyrinomonadaceae bacterium]
MKKSWIPRAALAGLVLLATTTLAFADIANPDNRNRSSNSDLKIQMQIATDDKAKEAKLVIPRAIWQQMRAQLDGNNSPSAATSAARFFNMTGAQTVMSGIFLSLAFAFGGVWLVRSRKGAERTARAVALCVALLLVGGVTAGVAYANAGPPPVARSLTSKILIPELQWWGAYGEVKIEIVEEGNEIKLILPRREITDKDRRQTE